MNRSTPGFPVHHQLPELLKLMSIESVMPCNHCILCHLFSFCLQSFPAPGAFPRSQFFASGGQSIGASASASVRTDFLQDWLIWSPCSPRDSQESSPTLTSIHDYWKTIALTTIRTYVGKVMCMLFNILSTFVIAFLPRNKCLLISWLQSLSSVILEPKKIKSVTVSTFPPYICHEVMALDAMILVVWMLSFKPSFSLSSSTTIKRIF